MSQHHSLLCLASALVLNLTGCIIDQSKIDSIADPVLVQLDRGYPNEFNRQDQEISLILLDFQSTDMIDQPDRQVKDFETVLDASVVDQNLDSLVEALDIAILPINDTFLPNTDQNLPNPPVQTTPEILCDGNDDDADQKVDEGIANPCGGCLAMDDLGCEAWVFDFVQDETQLLNPSRIVGLSAKILQASTFETENANCETYVLPRTTQSHLGVIHVDVMRDLNQNMNTLDLIPTYDQNRGRYNYLSSDNEISKQLYQAGDLISASWPGDRDQLLGTGAISVLAPLGLEESDDIALNQILDRYRTDGSNMPNSDPIRWTPKNQGLFSMYVGGSRQLFNQGNYRGIHHYLLSALLEDDGVLDLPPDLISPELGSSAVWAYFQRYQRTWLDLGRGSVEAFAGQQRSVRRSANGMSIETPLFDIISPSPANPTINPNADLQVEWSRPRAFVMDPKATMIVSLLLYAQEARQIICEIKSQDLTQITIPSRYLSPWPTGADALRQLTVRWVKKTYDLSLPDVGGYDESYSLILQLNE